MKIEDNYHYLFQQCFFFLRSMELKSSYIHIDVKAECQMKQIYMCVLW